MTTLTRRRAIAASAVALTALATTAATLTAPGVQASAPGDGGRQTYHRLADKPDRELVRLDLLAINDFHGNLEPVDPIKSSSGRVNNTAAGGAAFLARHLQMLRQKARANDASTITVAAGDLIGASPLLSAAFHDEPTIQALNRMRLQVASVGNHEFDEGYKELLRMQRGGCLPDGKKGENNQNSCPDGRRFPGAKFRYLAANVKWEDKYSHQRDTVFPGTKVIRVEGIKVGFIGMTLEDTPSIVSQSGIRGLDFTDEVKTANALVPQLRERGVKAIVVLLHQGAVPSDSTAYDDCTGVTGPALDIAQNLDPAIDAVISGHTHQPYNCTVSDPDGRPRLLTSASSFGRLVTNVHLLLNPRTHDVVRQAAYAQNRIVTNNLDGPDADAAPDSSTEPMDGMLGLIAKYKELVAPIANQVIGHIEGSDSLTAQTDESQESPLGNLIADAQRADESVIPPGGKAPEIAFMNPGGIRADLVENANDDVTYEAAFTVQPFNNFVVSMDLTGSQIRTLLDQQFTGANESFNKVLQVSGITYTWDQSEPPASKVVDSTVEVNGQPLRNAQTYRVVVNSFLSDGGDNFSVLREGTNKYVGGLDIDSLTDYLEAHDPYAPVATDRIDVRE